MQTRTTVITASVVIVAVGGLALGGPILYRELIAAPAAELPVLGTDGNALGGETLEPEALAGEWSLTEGSQVGYRVDEVLSGTDITVTGRTDEVTGTLTIDASDDGELLTLEAAEFTVDVASIRTDDPSRDSYFAERAIDTTQHPTATFALTEPVPFTQVPEPGAVEQASVSGELTIAGVTREVDVDVAVRSDGRVAEIAGSIPITFADFGVIAPDFAFVKVQPTGFVEFQLTAARS